ncbi:MAG TPA: hypothetical protein VGL35_12310 [Rhizomicrobium sp.]|jgi:hypothetical protein
MSARIPVDRAIADGYRFGFRHFLAVLGIAWLPYLVFAVIAVGLVWLLVPGLSGMFARQEFDVSVVMGLGRVAVLIAILAFITGAMVTVGVQRKALGLHPRPVWVWFSLGMPVWRMAGALFVGCIVVFLVALVTGAVCFGIWLAVRSLGDAVWPLRIIDVVAGCVVVIYVALRLLFFLPAVVVAEETFGLERAWTLGRGNVVRSFIVMVAAIVPIAIVFHLLFGAIFGSVPALHGASALSLRELARAAFLQFGAVGPFAILFQVLERILLAGVTNGAVASAWRARAGTHEQPAAPLAASPAA